MSGSSPLISMSIQMRLLGSCAIIVRLLAAVSSFCHSCSQYKLRSSMTTFGLTFLAVLATRDRAAPVAGARHIALRPGASRRASPRSSPNDVSLDAHQNAADYTVREDALRAGRDRRRHGARAVAHLRRRRAAPVRRSPRMVRRRDRPRTRADRARVASSRRWSTCRSASTARSASRSVSASTR